MHRSLALTLAVLAAASLFACDSGERARIHPDYPVKSEDDLSPPIVHDPIYECARAVYVTGFVPKAGVRVFAGGIELVGEASPHFGFADINLTRPLDVGESITATQTVDGVESGHSLNPTSVASLPDFPDGLPPVPVISAEIYDCGRIVPVGGLVPGARVSVAQEGAAVGSANVAGTWKGVFTSALDEGASVVATQTVCHDVPGKTAIESPPSAAVTVKPVPDPFRQPVLDPSTVVVGNDSVTLHDLYVGARVTVFDAAVPLASGFANSTSNWVALPDPLGSTGSIRGEHELCGTSAASDPVTPNAQLGTPRIVGPVCDTDLYVRVQGSVINATVVLLRNGVVAGMAGATPGELLLPPSQPFTAGDELTVVQYLGSNVSGVSAPVSVCACSAVWLRGRLQEILSGAPTDQKPVVCVASPIPLFQNTDPFDVLQVTLRADFATINGEPLKDDAKSPGTMSYVDPVTGNTVSINCTVEARGKSRFQYCNWRPLRLRFDSNPAGTLLSGTGKVIKIVTHCEWKSSPVLDSAGILPGTPAQDRRRLMQEFALYEVLGTGGSSALETRLVLLTYEDPSGTQLESEYAFFREREKRAAERCGFERLEADEGDPILPPDPTSDFQVRFHHRFLFSHDFSPQAEHNVIRMGSPNGMEYYIPYDFDLSGVIHPSYFKNNGWSIEENGRQLISWLESRPDQSLVRVQVASLLQHEDAMLQRVSAGLVDAPGRARLMAWLEDHVRRLKCFLN